MKNQEQNKKIPMHGDSIIKRMVFREAREASDSLLDDKLVGDSQPLDMNVPFSKDIVDVVMLGAELLCYTEKEHVRITNCVASSVYLMCNILND